MAVLAHKNSSKGTANTQRSEALIHIINRLLFCADKKTVRFFHRTLGELHVDHNVFCLDGRLELVGDLIAGHRCGFSGDEKEALLAFGERLGRLTSRCVFTDFLISYVRYAVQQAVRDGCCPHSTHGGVFSQQNNCRQRAAQLAAALSLSGFLYAGCGQEPLPVDTTSSGQTAREASAAGTKAEPTVAAAHQEALAQQPAETYIVQKGDSIRAIARRFGVHYRAVVRRNNIRYDGKRNWFEIHPGQNLSIPKTAVEKSTRLADSEPAPTTDTYVLQELPADDHAAYHLVEKGESLWTIAGRYRVTIASLVAANDIADPDRLIWGTVLKIPDPAGAYRRQKDSFHGLSRKEKVRFLKERTIEPAHPYIETIVRMAERFSIDPRLYAALIWEESWFDKNARSQDNCLKLVQLDPRYHSVSADSVANMEKSLRYLRHEYTYYRTKGFDVRSSTLCALAAYNGGNTRIRAYIREGTWDGRNIDTIPLQETKNHIKKIAARCKANYHAVL